MKYVAIFFIVLTCAGAGILALKYQAARQAAPPEAVQAVVAATPEPESTPQATPPPEPPPAPTQSVSAVAPAPASPAPTPETKPPTPAPAPAPERTGPLTDAVPPGPPEPIPLPVSRLALAYVGADPDAEDLWVEAINDPATSAHDRSDLIEDLNEEGFMDPKNITYEELPLVINRLAMIEDLAPYAMDQVNADAFAEAYKDLANIYMRLAGQQ